MAKNIKDESRTANKLFIWTDNDREGEHIGYEIFKIACSSNPNLTMSNVHRAVFNNIEESHIRQAAKNPRQLDMRLVNAVIARIEIDFRIGTALTRFQTLAIQDAITTLKKDVISYGPCQFPTLGFVVDQYNRVTKFVPENFWYISIDAKMPQSFVDFQKQQQQNEENTNTKRRKTSKNRIDVLKFTWSRTRLFDRAVAYVLFHRCINTGTRAQVINVKKVPTSRWRPLPLTTVELQKVCSKFRGLTPKKVLDAAEKLYNKGFISYPRTETDVFDESIDLNKLVEKQFHSPEWGNYAKRLLGHTQPPQPPTICTPRKGKHNDKAHPPIHPVAFVNSSALEDEGQRIVFEFVARRFLACVSPDAKGATTTITLNWGGETFFASGLEVLERNFLEVYYPYQTWASSAVQIPPNLFSPGATVELDSADLLEGTTSPPRYLSETDLISLMDANGIGTDATMADHIQTIIDRNYVNKINPPGESGVSRLIPSALGYGLVEGYDKIGFEKSLSKPFLRKEMEESMVKIANGVSSKEEILRATLSKYYDVYNIARRQVNVLVNTTKSNFERVVNIANNTANSSSTQGRGRNRGQSSTT